MDVLCFAGQYLYHWEKSENVFLCRQQQLPNDNSLARSAYEMSSIVYLRINEIKYFELIEFLIMIFPNLFSTIKLC